MASKIDSNEQTDADILQCKADIRRARDIIRPFTGQNTREAKEESAISKEKEKKAREDTSSIPIEAMDVKEAKPAAVVGVGKRETVKTPESKERPSSQDNIPKRQAEQIKPAKDISAGLADTKQEKAGIPRFNLAEEIMAEQRKITAIRRRAPGKKIEAQSQEGEVETTSYAIEQPMLALLEQGQIIAEIVARDIERLRRGGALVDSG